jgi:TRAP transporter TAXI family solute receptor
MKKGKWIQIVTIAGLVLFFIAAAVPGLCSSTKPVVHMKIGAGRVTHPHHALGLAIADTISRKSSWLKVEAVATPGYSGNYELMRDNPKAYLALGESCNMFWMPKSDKYKRYDKYRIIGYIGPIPQAFSTYNKKLKTVQDLAGKKVNVHRRGGTQLDDYKVIFKDAGVLDKVKHVYQGFGGGMKSMADGKADVAPALFDWIHPDKYLRGAMIEQAQARGPLYYISLNRARLTKLHKNGQMAGFPIRVPPGALDPKTQPDEVIGVSMVAFFLADIRTPDDIVYEATKIFYENGGTYAKWHSQGANMSKELIPSYIFSPDKMHPAALRYYKENNVKVGDIFDKIGK